MASTSNIPWDASELALFTEPSELSAYLETPGAPTRSRLRFTLTAMALVLILCLFGLIFMMHAVTSHPLGATPSATPAVVVPATSSPATPAAPGAPASAIHAS